MRRRNPKIDISEEQMNLLDAARVPTGEPKEFTPPPMPPVDPRIKSAAGNEIMQGVQLFYEDQEAFSNRKDTKKPYIKMSWSEPMRKWNVIVEDRIHDETISESEELTTELLMRRVHDPFKGYVGNITVYKPNMAKEQEDDRFGDNSSFGRGIDRYNPD